MPLFAFLSWGEQFLFMFAIAMFGLVTVAKKIFASDAAKQIAAEKATGVASSLLTSLFKR